jgi:hypothetical protein
MIDAALASVQLYEARNFVSVISSLSSSSRVCSLNWSGVTRSNRAPKGGAGGVRMGPIDEPSCGRCPCDDFGFEGLRHGLRSPRGLEKLMIWLGEAFNCDG